ncbi:MAG: serine hydrolase [Firmicutes bacterium]|nr:serine hydrolase [Candidatus Fermentithermobacillaceae bacterium]
MSSGWLEFEKRVKALMSEWHIVGASVAVCDRERVIYAKGFGVRNLATSDAVTPETIFGIASVSKSFTAMAIMGLVDQGKVSVDDPVIKYLPQFKLLGVQDMSTIQIKHLLSHTTGLPPIRRRQDIVRFDDHIKYLATEPYTLLGKPGQYFSYANDTFLLLGAIIQRVTGRLFRRYMTENILDTIGMHRSTYSLEELEQFDNVSVPYIYNRKSKTWEEQPWPKLGTYEVGGGVRSNALDLVKYIQVYLNDGVSSSGRIISAESLRVMCTPVIKTGRNTYYGFGLQITPNYSGVTLIEHSGGQPGVSSNFGFVPEAGIGAVVLTNVTGIPASAIWLMAINTALGLPIDQKRSVETEWEAPFDHLARLVGEYRCAEGGNVTISLQGGQLKAKVNDEEFVLKVSGEDTAFFEDMGQQHVIRFFFDDAHRPWAVLFHSRMLRRIESGVDD